MPARNLYSGLFIFLAIVLFLPALQQWTGLVTSAPLKGVVQEELPDKKLSVANWMDGSFQEKNNELVQRRIGFRPDFIRLTNQINYSLFKTTTANVVIGNNDNLFENEYIKAYLGEDYVGYKAVRNRVAKIKFIQDTLTKLGKQFVFVYAPIKVRSNPQNIPKDFLHATKCKIGPNNYDTYLRLGDSMGVNQLDFGNWFASIKNSPHLLFAEEGIHWTYYGAMIAADSLNNYMNRGAAGKYKIVWDDQEEGRIGKPEEQETDLANTLNLISTPAYNRFFHPTISYPDQQDKPRVIYIGDSYMWTWIYIQFPQKMNSSYQFWSYYNDVYGTGIDKSVKVYNMNAVGELMKADWVVMLNTECNFSHPGADFPEEFYRYFTEGKLR